MGNPKVIDLHLANDFQELKSKARPNKDYSSYHIDNLCRTADKLYEQAQQHEKSGDEEMNYYCLFRFVDMIFLAIKKEKSRGLAGKIGRAFGDGVTKIKYETKLSDSVKKLEDLETRLQARYRLRDEANQLSVEEEKAKLAAEVGAAGKLGVNRATTTGYASNGNPQDKNCGVHVQKGACGYNSIMASELYRILSCSTPSSETMTVLIMDCRKEADFEASHIRTVVKAGNRHQVISIPKAILTPGLTPAQVDKQLPTRSWGPWRSRHDCDLLVVMDWYSNLKKITEETRCLMDTMLKWDQESYKNPPCLLDGGYEKWLHMYPHVTTNSRVSTFPSSSSSIPNGGIMDLSKEVESIGYPDLEDPMVTLPASQRRPALGPSDPYPTVPQINNYMMADLGDSGGGRQMPSLTETDVGLHRSPMGRRLPATPGSSTLPAVPGRGGAWTNGPIITSKPVSPSVNSSRTDIPPKIDRELKPKEITERTLRAQQEQQELSDEALKRLKSVQELSVQREMIRLQKEKQAEEEMRRILQEKEESLLDQIEAMMQSQKKTEEQMASNQAELTRLRAAAVEWERRQGVSMNSSPLAEVDEGKVAHERTLKQKNDEIRRLKAEVKRLQEKQAAEENRTVGGLNLQSGFLPPAEPGVSFSSSKFRDQRVPISKAQLPPTNGGLVIPGGGVIPPWTPSSSSSPQHMPPGPSIRTSPPGRPPSGRPSTASVSRAKDTPDEVGRPGGDGPVLPPSAPECSPSDRDGPHEGGDIGGGSNLRRSYSSPNIAKLNQQSRVYPPSEPQVDLTHTSMPSVDRTLKPPEVRLEELNLNAFRPRDFDAVEGNKSPGLTGLKNLGNTCYMNSTLQCLSATPDFASYFVLSRKPIINREAPLTKGSVAEELAVLLRHLWCGRYRSLSPKEFKRLIGGYCKTFAGYDQQDAHELLMILLGWLHDDLNRVSKKKPISEQKNDGLSDVEAAERFEKDYRLSNSSLISDTFRGVQKSTVRCRACEHESVVFESFLDLSLPIPAGKQKCTIFDCLQLYLGGEPVEWKCDQKGCRNQKAAVKKIDIWKLPKVLVIHLKRFKQDSVLRGKLVNHVDFPVQKSLDLSSYARSGQSPPPYKLYAVTIHTGTMDGGHYTAICRNPAHLAKEKWFKFDDHDVKDYFDEGARLHTGAYILYYCDPRLLDRKNFP